MESSVTGPDVASCVLKKAKMESDGGFRGSPEPDEESTWEQLAARHPQLAELAGRVPAAWAKRRGSHDRPPGEFSRESRTRERPFRDFFFDDLPSEFREHIPNRWNRHFEPEEEIGDPAPAPPPAPAQVPHPGPAREPAHVSTDKATQTVLPDPPERKENPLQPQYGLRNTVDLGRKSAQEAGQSDEGRSQRSMSAPPEGRAPPAGPPPPSAQPPPQQQQQPTVRHIPIFVEGRDEPVINVKSEAFAETRGTPPKEEFYQNHEIPQPFHPTPHFNRAFGSPFKGFGGRNVGGFPQNKAFNQQQPARDQSQQTFKQNPAPPAESAPPPHKTEPAQQPPSPPPPAPQPCINDPILKIQLIQKDVLELMTSVENFTGKSKKDKEYIYLDEMLTRNLIKLDDIETEGKENIRLARKEAIKCIQKCIAVLETKAESNAEMAKRDGAPSAAEQEQPSRLTNGAAESSPDKERGKSEEKQLPPQPMEVEAPAPSV